jgi:hypothetical protein
MGQRASVTEILYFYIFYIFNPDPEIASAKEQNCMYMGV